jgi:anhydro-N-acetylmuramic acid kinase
MTLYLGLMSGTSLDGVDAVLAGFDAGLRVLGHVHTPFPVALHNELLALNASGPDEIHRAALAANTLMRTYAEAAERALALTGVQRSKVRALGAHGQTVRHQPGAFDGTGYTVQLHNGALLAELTGIDVVCDFRSRDVAAGGQGAPLVPAFHAAVFGGGGPVAVLNLGGIGNLSLIDGDRVRGFDTGPANALLDGWCRQCLGTSYDDRGAWAAAGTVLPALLSALLAEPWLQRPPPRSTGRDLFNLDWLAPRLASCAPHAGAQDVQATLAEFTARTVSEALSAHAPGTRELLVCGGGAFNDDLMARLARLLPRARVESTSTRGLPPTQVEAAAFAWLARALVEREPGNRVEVTGARGPRLLGALYPA